MTTTTVPSDRWALTKMPAASRPPPRVTIIGEPGIGKTTFAAQAPDVVIVPTEDGAMGVDAARLPNTGKCETFDVVLRALDMLATEDHAFKWVALDTLNAADQLAADLVCKRDFGSRWMSARGQEGFNAFGKGEKATAQEMRRLLVALDKLQARGMGVLLLAHVGLHKSANALGSDFMKFGADLNKHSWALVCNWADQVGFAHREMRVSKREGETKAKAAAIGAERWITFEGGPGLDAKSRAGYEMPERILLSWDEYDAALNSDRAEALVDQAVRLLADGSVGLRDAVSKRLGGKITKPALRDLGKQKLEALIGWLLSKQDGRS